MDADILQAVRDLGAAVRVLVFLAFVLVGQVLAVAYWIGRKK